MRLQLYDKLRSKSQKNWWREWELNPRPTAYESAALPLSYPARKNGQYHIENLHLCQRDGEGLKKNESLFPLELEGSLQQALF